MNHDKFDAVRQMNRHVFSAYLLQRCLLILAEVVMSGGVRSRPSGSFEEGEEARREKKIDRLIRTH